MSHKKEDANMSNKIYVQMFQNFEIQYKDKTLAYDSIHSNKISNLLAYFLYHHNIPIFVDDLEDILWDDDETDNPVGALKNLVYRLRVLLKKSLGDYDFIKTSRGYYQWNPEFEIQMDCTEFERCCTLAKNSVASLQEQITYYEKAQQLYQGAFLSKLSGEHWILPITTYYHSLYLSQTKEYLLVLQEQKQYEEIEKVCKQAIGIDALDEEFHYYMILALAKQNKRKLAIEHYSSATNLLYEKLGVKTSTRLQSIYEELLKENNGIEIDINIIQKQMQEEEIAGAYLCEFGVFKQIYRQQCRSLQRIGMSCFIALLTIQPEQQASQNEKRYLDVLHTAMANLEYVIRRSLRSGDIVTKYSGNQYLILLPTCNFETSSLVMKRILKNYQKHNYDRYVFVKYSVSEILYSTKTDGTL